MLTESKALSANTQQQVAQAFTQLSDYERAALVSLAKLGPPSSKENDWQLYLTGIQEIATNSTSLAAAAQVGQFRSNSALVITIQTLKEHIDATARRDGFTQCSKV
jgi:hypothetical protein